MAKYRASPGGRPETVGEAIELYLEQAVLKSEKRRRQLRYLLGFAAATFADWRLDELDADAIAAWQARLTDGSRYSIVGALRQWSKTAVARGWLARDVVRAAGPNPIPAIRNEDRPFASWAEIERIAAQLNGDFAEWPIVMAGSGMRPSESWALDWDRVDLDAGVIHIDRAWDGREIVRPKNRRARQAVLFPQAVEALRRIPRRITAKGSVSPLVWSNRHGAHVDYRKWGSRHWRPALEQAGMGRSLILDQFGRPPRVSATDPIDPELRALLQRIDRQPLMDAAGRRVWIALHVPYDLRHTYATWSLAAGVPSRDCAEEMGTSLEMFERHYGHRSREANLRNASRRANYEPGKP